MWMNFEVELRLKLGEKASAFFGRSLEVSLDCMVCQRRRRTIKFGEHNSICHSGGKQHPFPGQILSINYLQDGVIYQIGYYYESFLDLKNKDISQPELTWGRVSFNTHCLVCDKRKEGSVQTNLVRPRTSQCCIPCNNILYTDTEVYPKFNIGSFQNVEGVSFEQARKTVDALLTKIEVEDFDVEVQGVDFNPIRAVLGIETDNPGRFDEDGKVSD